MSLDKPTLLWAIQQLRESLECDPYTGELYSSSTNLRLLELIEHFKAEGELQ